MKFNFLQNKKGFTLLELLVVIFIIVLIGSLVTVYFFQIRKNVRDSKRLSDISEIQLALENYKFFEGQYPVELIPGEPLIGSTTEKIFLIKVPQNPSYYNSDCISGDYHYYYDDSSGGYKISFCLEGSFENYNNGPKCAFMGEIFEGNCFFCESYVSDIDGNIYDTVAIGNQCWMAENLNTGIMINGSISQSDDSTIEKYCYNNIESNCDIYGGLYQWNEMMNYTTSTTQGICPTGWHVPTDSEWTELTRYVIDDPLCDPDAGCSPAGLYLKASSMDPEPNWDGSNIFGFNVIPSGYYFNFSFNFLNIFSFLWSSSEYSIEESYNRSINAGSSLFSRSSNNKTHGFSIRCLRD